MLRISRNKSRILSKIRFASDTVENDDFVVVPEGPNKGFQVRTNFKNKNPRNLEMMNIAHRDLGWAAGPHNTRRRFLKASEIPGTDIHEMRLASTNLPAQNSYHYVEIVR